MKNQPSAHPMPPRRSTAAILLALALTLITGIAHAQTTHTVKSGETLDRIAKQYNVRLAALIAENNLGRPDLLQPGQTLRIPVPNAPALKTYTVQEGDSIGTIARDFGISPDAIVKQNNITDPNKISIGQVLKIPLAAPPASAPKYTLAPQLKKTLDTIPVRSGRWKYIVIHHSATASGSVQGMDNYHRYKRHMENGLAYHFVIGNGRGMKDGQIAIGQRWRSQLNGGHLASERLNTMAIGICLVGDYNKTRPTPAQMKSLSALTAYLSQRTRINATAIRMHRQINTKPTECPGKLFPMNQLLENLP